MSEGLIPGATSIVETETAQTIDLRLLNPFLKESGLIGVDSTFTHKIEPDRPVSFNSAEYVFDFPNTATSYADLKNTEMYVCGELLKDDGTKITDTDLVVIGNNFLYTLFESATMYVGKNQVELYIANHPFKSFIRQLMDFRVVSSQLRTVGMNIVVDSPEYKSAYEANVNRRNWTAGSKNLELMGRLKGLDFFNTEAYLLPSTPVKIKFRRSREPFYVITDPDSTEQTKYHFNITDIKLYVPAIQCSSTLQPLLEMATDKFPATYPFSMLDMRRFDLPRNIITKTFRRVFDQRLPRKICVGFYSQDAFAGNTEFAALTTYNLDIRKFTVSINGVAVRSYCMNFNKDMYLETYQKFLNWMNVKADDTYFISYETFKFGYRYMCVDFLENCMQSCESVPIQQGYIDLEITLGNSAPDDLIMCVFSLSSETLEIDKTRSAKFSPTIV